tara:strand:- start:4463 stop:4726 length:264 start_codon:yes stop_codon:yes gene_type:complete
MFKLDDGFWDTMAEQAGQWGKLYDKERAKGITGSSMMNYGSKHQGTPINQMTAPMNPANPMASWVAATAPSNYQQYFANPFTGQRRG